MPTADELYRLALAQQLGGEPPTSDEGLDLFQPIRTVFGATQGIGGRVAGALFPGALERAREETKKAFGVTETSPWYEKVEAAPGAGDVAAQLVPQSIRESLVGQAVGPVARMAGNIVGDPTTYTPAVLSRAGGLIARGVPAAAEALAAGDRLAALRAMRAAGGIKDLAYETSEVLRHAEPLAMGSAAALAYGPGVVEATLQGAEQTMNADSAGEMLASGANTMLMAGLGILMGKGLIDGGRAWRTLDSTLKAAAPVPESRPKPSDLLQRRAAEVLPEGGAPPPEGPPGAPPEGPTGPDLTPTHPADLAALQGPAEVPLYGRGGEIIGWQQPDGSISPTPQNVPHAPLGTRSPDELAQAMSELRLAQEVGRALQAPPGPPRLVTPAGRLESAAPEPAIVAAPAAAPERPLPPSLLMDQLQASIEQARAAQAHTVQPEPVVAPRVEPAPAAEAAAAAPARADLIESAVRHVAKTPEDAAYLNEVVQTPQVQHRLLDRLSEVWDEVNRNNPDDQLRPLTEKETSDTVHGFLRNTLKERPRPTEVAPPVEPAPRETAPPAVEAAPEVPPAVGPEPAAPGAEEALTALGEQGPTTTLLGRQSRGRGEGAIAAAEKEGGAAVPTVRAREVDTGAAPYEAAQALRGEEPLKDNLARFATEERGAQVGQWRVSDQTVKRFERYARLREQGLSRDEAIRKAAKGSLNAERNFVGKFEKAHRDWMAKARGMEVPEAPTRAPNAGQVERLRSQKDVLARRFPVKPAEMSADEFLASLPKERLGELLQDWADFAAKRAPFKLGSKVGRELGDDRLRMFAEDLGLTVGKRENTLKLLRKVANRLGVDAEGLKEIRSTLREAKGARARELLRARPAEGWRGGSKVTIEKGSAGAERARITDYKDLEGVGRDVDEMLQKELVDEITIDVKGKKGRELSRLLTEDYQGKGLAADPESMGETFLVVKDNIGRMATREMDLGDWLDIEAKLRDVAGVDWTNPASRLHDVAVGLQGTSASVRTLAEAMGRPDEVKKAFGGVAAKLGLKLDDREPAVLIGDSGGFHQTYLLNGEGGDVVVRLGKSPYVKLPKDVQESLMAPVLDHGTVELFGEKFTYTAHPRAYSPGFDINIGYVTDPNIRAEFGVEPGRTAPSQAYQEQLDRSVRNRLPPGITLSNYLEDASHLNWATDLAALNKGDLYYGGGMWRAGQTGYIEVRPNSTGVVRQTPDGKWWKLTILDRGSISPKEPNGEWAMMNQSFWVGLQTRKPDEALSVRQLVQRQRHYRADEAEGIKLGEYVQANHDRMASPEYEAGAARLTSTKALNAMANVIDDLKQKFEEAGGGKLRAKFAGTTVSPYNAGLYHDGNVFMNMVEQAHANSSYDGFLRSMVHTLHHEVSHVSGGEHGNAFVEFHTSLMRAIEGQRGFDQHVEMLRTAIPEEVYNRLRDEMVPEFRQMREVVNGESWRGAEGQQGVPAGTAPRRVAPEPSELGGGATGPPADRVLRVPPGGDVPRGAPEQAGQLRPATAPGRGPAQGPTEGVAARRGERRGVDEAQASWERFRDKVGRLEAREPRGVLKQETAQELLDALVEEGGPRLQVGAVLQKAFDLSADILRGKSQDEILRLASEKPAGGKSAINFTHMTGVSDELKARMTLTYQLTKGKGIWERDKPEAWADVAPEALKLLGIDTPEGYVASFKRRGVKGLTSTESYLLKTVHNELAGRVDEARARLESAMADPQVTEATTQKLWDELKTSELTQMAAGVEAARQLTGVARALAIAGAETRRLDPRAAVETRFLASIRERLKASGRFRDKAALEEAAQGAWHVLLDGFDRGDNNIDEFRRAMEMVLGGKTKLDKVLELYKANLIGWPSQIANITSNTMFGMARSAEQVVAGGLDFLRSKLTGTPREVFLGEAPVSLMAMRRGFAEAWGPWYKDTMRAFRLQGPDVQKALQEGALLEDLMNFGGAISGKKGEFIRFPFHMMQAQDSFAKHVIRTDEIWRGVYRKLRKGELKRASGESFAAATARIASDWTDNWAQWERNLDFDLKKLEDLRPLMEHANEVARTATFQKDLGALGKGGANFLREHPAFQFLVPFHRTPTNIIKETLKRTPLGFASVAKHWKKLSRAEQMTELAQPVMGTMLMAGLYSVASTGGGVGQGGKFGGGGASASWGPMTGGGPPDFESQDALRAVGWQPYSIWVPGAGYVSYARLEPIASIMGLAADMAEAAKQGEVHDFRSAVEKLSQSLGENLTNKTFLSTLDGVLGAISKPTQMLPRFIKQMQSSVVPNSIGFVPFGHLARALDPTFRQSEALTADVFLAKVPFASQRLAPQYGPTGEERMRTGTFPERLISPFYRTVPQEGAKAQGTQELVRLQAVPQTPLRYWTSPQGYRVPLRPEERQKIAQSLSEAITVVGQRLLNDPSYQRLPDNELDPKYQFGQKTKEDVLRNLISKYRRRTFAQIKPTLQRRARTMYRERET